jgi:hypothetical protein
MSTPPIEHLSLWIIAPALALALMIAHEAGVQVRRYNLRRAEAKGLDTVHDATGGYKEAIIGLMALLVGFTFAMALDRYNTRRTLVVEEASAIGAHYRRLITLPEPQRTRLADALLRYLDAREAFSQGHADRALAAAEAAGARLWLATAATLAGQGAPPNSEAVLASTEAMLEAAVRQREALTARVPVDVVRAMLLYALIAAGFIGYGDPQGRRHFVPSTVQMVLLALAISLVLDLDTANSGAIQVDQSPLIQIVERTRSFEAERHGSQVPAWLRAQP